MHTTQPALPLFAASIHPKAACCHAPALSAMGEALAVAQGDADALRLKKCVVAIEAGVEEYGSVTMRRQWKPVRTGFEACRRAYEEGERWVTSGSEDAVLGNGGHRGGGEVGREVSALGRAGGPPEVGQGADHEHADSLKRLRPLPSDAVPAVDPDAINWNDVYWGYESNRSERRMIVRPLPRSITDRIPLELVEHILDSLRWETRDLYNCALLYLFDGSLVSRAPTPPLGYPPVNAPHLSKVALNILDDILLFQLSHLADVSPEQRRCAESIVRKLGPSLDSLAFGFKYGLQPHDWHHLSFLACCTRLSTLQLLVKANPIDSWQGLVSGLHEMLSRCSSPVMRTLQVYIYMLAPGGSPSTSTHPDSEFWTIDLTQIHVIMKQPLFDALQDANIHFGGRRGDARLTCDTVLTAEEMERRLRLILEPWDKRGILTAEGYNEPTAEELPQRKPEEARITEERDPSGGASGEEAQSSEDEIVLTLDQEDEDGREAAVSDLVESSEG
ncbi:hypothetical protein FOMPIDRAFT_1055704 [Fomitopsis schrenkii]|uniref:Uncharacterized protein n=1 Tax=Fomitopsis schrenkii TaxID=2126942 RepID=S8DRF6_FOMSC|nr:hypothetical protein FOMPIDRAFT_1055704 [Fomitopsis schrenkii]